MAVLLLRMEGEKKKKQYQLFRVNNARNATSEPCQRTDYVRIPDWANGRLYVQHTIHYCARDGWLNAVKHLSVSVAIEAKLASDGFETDSWASGGMCMSGYIRDEVRPLQDIRPGRM